MQFLRINMKVLTKDDMIVETEHVEMQIKGGANNSGFGYAVGVVGDMDNDGTVEFVASDISVDNDAVGNRMNG